ncbi:LysR family transcriptional regulator [Sorangium sp. So ce136]|uniref:LysR family transcriptional regulator n=1 Tax=Sorangium sp. So ce136 TaxID=3133284 RepID=UPI003F0EDED5
MRIEDVDFNGLRALYHLLETRSVTQAARRLGTTQPNMSRSLARLREVFGDPLFVSTGRAIEPTPMALALQPDVERALSALRAVFDPMARQKREDEPFALRVATSDYGTLVVLRPWLVQQVEARPMTTLRIVQPSLETIGALERGEVDLALIPRVELDGLEQFVFRPIVDDEHVIVTRRGHPLARGRATLERYLACGHVVVGNSVPGFSSVQRALVRLDRSRDVRARVPSLLLALSLAAETDMVATLPARIVRASGLPLTTRPIPFEVEPFTLHAVFHPRMTTDPHHRRIRESLFSKPAARGRSRISRRPSG